MKPKSSKLRNLITLHALWKYADSTHRLNKTKLNKFLKPYNLDCTRPILQSTMQSLKDFGIDVVSEGKWNNCGVYLKDRPLSGESFDVLIYAITTNPHLTKEETERILKSLVPCVTVYQEPLLTSCVEKNPRIRHSDDFYNKYGIIHNAIAAKRRVRYCVKAIKYNKDKQSVDVVNKWPNLFTPKCLYQANGKTYMVGYNNTEKRPAAIDVDLITEIKIAFMYNDPFAEEVSQILDSIDEKSIIENKDRLIYEGPVSFKCNGKYLIELYRNFGSNSTPVTKDTQSICIYSVDNAKIYESTLYGLINDYDNNIRIIGPQHLQDIIKEYLSNVGNTLVSPSIRYRKQK